MARTIVLANISIDPNTIPLWFQEMEWAGGSSHESSL